MSFEEQRKADKDLDNALTMDVVAGVHQNNAVDVE